jgi:hypothetical protein
MSRDAHVESGREFRYSSQVRVDPLTLRSRSEDPTIAPAEALQYTNLREEMNDTA